MSKTHGAKPIRGQANVSMSPINEGRFGRMLRRLPPAPHYSDEELHALAETMRETIVAPSGGWASSPTVQAGGDNPNLDAAYTYFGQFIDHDITFDPNSSLQQQNDPDALHDFRTPKFDLDSLYGSGPDDEPFQYLPNTNPARLLVEPNLLGEEDLPRTSHGIAIIGDPRNDENTIVSQLQLTFLKFHNKIAAEIEADATIVADQKFAEAQRRVRWTYQQVVIQDFLRRLVGDGLLDSLFSVDPTSGEPDFNLRYYRAKKNAYMPVEFSAAAYRFGHSQVRGVYDLNDTVTARPIFVAGAAGPQDDLRGNRPLPAGWTVDWAHFVDLSTGTSVQPGRLIDSHISNGLFTLPDGSSLPLRNLQRGQSMDLPSGQDVAKFMGAPVLSGVDMGGVVDPTPLWYYVLKEAELQTGGERLGSVGGRIVAEVLLGLLYNDKTSWVNVEPSWTTTIPVAGEYVTLADIIRYTLA